MAKALNIPTDGKNTVNHINGWNSDIITVIHSNVPAATKQMREVAHTFNKGNDLNTCKAIWDFLKKEIKYVKDPEGYQNIKLPGRFVATGSGDCKSYSLFTASILENLGIPYSFRYTSYGLNPTPQHVYIVTDSGIIIDGVWNKFNSEKAYTSKKDYKMKIQTLSGIGCNTCYNPRPLGSVVMIGNTMPVGNIFKKGAKAVKKAAVKVQDKAKSTGIVKAAAKAQTKAKNTGVVRAAAKLQTKAKSTGLVKAAAKVQNRVKKEGGKVITLAAPRRAYRTLVAINFRGWATQLNKNRQRAGQIFEQQGGKASELFQSIDKGIKRKAIFPSAASKIQSVNGIGEPSVAATITATLAVATPIVLAFSQIIKSASEAKKAAQEAFGKQKETGTDQQAGGNLDPNSFLPNTNESASGETTEPNNVAPSSGSSMLTPLLIGGGLLLLAKATKII